MKGTGQRRCLIRTVPEYRDGPMGKVLIGHKKISVVQQLWTADGPFDPECRWIDETEIPIIDYTNSMIS